MKLEKDRCRNVVPRMVFWLPQDEKWIGLKFLWLAAWKCHYEKLLNVEFPWGSNTLSEEQPFQGSSIRITTEMVSEAFTKMKKEKATGPSGLNVEIILAGGDDDLGHHSSYKLYYCWK